MKTVKKNIFLLVIAMVLVLSLTVGLTLAYFSDYTEAKGGAKLALGNKTEITEDVTKDSKTVYVTNTGETNVVVRVMIVGPTGMKVTAEGKWEPHGDYYYYNEILKPGDTTKGTLFANTKDYPVGTDLGDEYQIVVVHESAQPTYDGNNNVEKPEGWDYIPAMTAE